MLMMHVASVLVGTADGLSDTNQIIATGIGVAAIVAGLVNKSIGGFKEAAVAGVLFIGLMYVVYS